MDNFRGIRGWRYRLLLRPIVFWFAASIPFLYGWAQGAKVAWWWAIPMVVVLGIAAGWASDKLEELAKPKELRHGR